MCSSGDDDERFLSYAPTQLESRRELLVSDKEKEIVSHFHEEDDVYGDSCTVGSTSKSSSDWRSSINYRDNNSGTDQDPNFSSSSRRSCPKWESYTVFHKYDEEMKLLDRISAQKLSETGYLYFTLLLLLVPTLIKVYTIVYLLLLFLFSLFYYCHQSSLLRTICFPSLFRKAN